MEVGIKTSNCSPSQLRVQFAHVIKQKAVADFLCRIKTATTYTIFIPNLLQLILNAKCHAIRDAQILEKAQVRREMDDEEKRLDVMMEVDRQNAIKIQEEIEKKRKEERLIGKCLCCIDAIVKRLLEITLFYVPEWNDQEHAVLDLSLNQSVRKLYGHELTKILHGFLLLLLKI